MFSPSFARALRSTGSGPTAPVGSLCRAALTTRPTPFRPSHQRRNSSSKPSAPPSSRKKSAEELKRTAEIQVQAKEADTESIDKATETPLAKSTNNVPHVASTTHRHAADVCLSTFFGLHLPLSPRRDAWQQSSSMEAFEAHFYPADPKNARPIEKIWPTEEDIHLLASQLPHFLPPPPPVALDQSAPQPDALMALETTLEVYAGINEFIDEVALYSEQKPSLVTQPENVGRRRGGMLLISVKRQRKLKMKKHKYKKLMKRTRLERRKLDRT